ncbi:MULTISPECIES: hypothetical protein [unclassified Sphingopyxis]|uniref:hypothetical protein n=1 Tax=unclassified Sphingopyxis TaxID=2614943 RepID=UPI000A4582DE|nr:MULTISPECIES: hypothetical protein [unclassified Sphingopyxis]USI75864.1 hypothetical protein KEC45_13930 [Sphingopyxis sp. USTB-05]
MTPTRLISNRIARVALVLTGLNLAAPAMAEEVNQIAVYGEVAPRCWVVDPMKIVATNAAPKVISARAICNHGRPVLASEVRMVDSDGLLIKRVPAATERPVAAASLSARTALEIVVTPQL